MYNSVYNYIFMLFPASYIPSAQDSLNPFNPSSNDVI